MFVNPYPNTFLWTTPGMREEYRKLILLGKDPVIKISQPFLSFYALWINETFEEFTWKSMHFLCFLCSIFAATAVRMWLFKLVVDISSIITKECLFWKLSKVLTQVFTVNHSICRKSSGQYHEFSKNNWISLNM